MLLLSACCATAGASPAASVEEVRACLAANVPGQSSVADVRLESQGSSGRKTTHEGRIYWRRGADGLSQTLICMEGPRDIRGLAYLVHERESGQSAWVFLPEDGRSLRITTRDAASRAHIARTAISYEDLRYLPVNLSRAESEPASEGRINDRPVLIVPLSLPAGGESLYERILGFIDPGSCLPLRIEFFEAGDEPRKTATADPATISTESGTAIARSFTIEDRKRGVRTEMQVERFEIDPELPERLFSPPLRPSHCPR
jgi:hypothetical protein